MSVRLSPGDLANARFAISPINQTVMYMAQFRRGTRATFGSSDDWSLAVRSGSAARFVLRMLAMRPGNRPDFLTPAPPVSEDGVDIDTELDAVRATPGSLIAEELDSYLLHPRMRDMLASADGNERIKNRIADGLHQIHCAVFGPDWEAVKAALRADINRRITELGYYGLDHTISGLHPRISYHDGLLSLDSYRNDPDIEGNGNGLVLVPAIVASKWVAIKVNARDPIVLVYPIGAVERTFRRSTRGSPPPQQRLRSVIGRSRVSILLVLFKQPRLSTSELAERCGIAISSASEHATALRKAGLIHSYRDRNRMLHALTPLGAQLAHTEADVGS